MSIRAQRLKKSMKFVHYALFSGTLRGGPYAPAELLEPGDWLYYVNHSYNDIEHSGVFIGWTDYEQRQGLILSYAGEGRGEPGRYKVYDLYMCIR